MSRCLFEERKKLNICCKLFCLTLFVKVHNGYLFALPDRDAEGRRVIFSVARCPIKL